MNIEIDQIVRLIARRELFIFVGAGISFAEPSSLPGFAKLQNETIWALCHGLETTLRNTYEPIHKEIADTNKEYKSEIALRFMDLPPEYVFERCKHNIVCDNQFSDRYELKPLERFKDTLPNETHFILAKLLLNGCIPVIFTTNFDPLIEKAVAELGEREPNKAPIQKCWRPEHFTKIENSKSNIIKLHGCIDDPDSIIICLDEVGRNCAFPKLDPLKYFIENYHVLFSGYRGADLDIFSCLATTRCKGIIWNVLSKYDIVPKVKRLLKKQNGMIIEGDLCELFNTISEKLNLGKAEVKKGGNISKRGILEDLTDWARNIESYSKMVIMGDLWEHVGEIRTAIRFFYSGYELTKEAENKEAENAFLERLAGTFYEMQNFDEARNICNLILDNAKNLPPVSKILTYINTFQIIGLIEAKKDIKMGMKWVIQSLRNQEELEKIDQKTRYKKADIMLNAGNMLYRGQLMDEAMEYYKSALGIYDEFGNVQGRAKVLSNVGNLLLQKAEYDKSIYHYKEAEYLFNETGDISRLSHILLSLAIAHNKKGIKKTARQYALAAMEHFQILGDTGRLDVARQLI